jgi:ribonuclease HI
MIDLWCDGSSSLKTGRCAWSVVGERVRLCGGMPGTNQLSELTALYKALEIIPAGGRGRITTDSEYAIKGVTEWRERWQANGWRNSAGEDVKHAGLWREVHRLYDSRFVSLVHVRGHTGNEWNELADALAGLRRAVDEGRAPPESLDEYLRINSA